MRLVLDQKGNMIGWGSDVYNFRIATAGTAGLTWGSCGSGTEGYFATSSCFVDGLNTLVYFDGIIDDRALDGTQNFLVVIIPSLCYYIVVLCVKFDLSLLINAVKGMFSRH